MSFPLRNNYIAVTEEGKILKNEWLSEIIAGLIQFFIITSLKKRKKFEHVRM